MDFQTQSEGLDHIKNEISERIDKLGTINSESEWGLEIQALSDKFSELQLSFGEFNDSIPELDQQDQDDARKYYAKMNSDMQTLEANFNIIKKTGFVSKTPSLAEQFKDKDVDQEMPEQLRHIEPDDVETANLPNNSLVDESNLTPVEALPTDINSPLNPLEADIETSEDGRTLTASCSKTTKIIIAVSSIFIILAIISFIYFISD